MQSCRNLRLAYLLAALAIVAACAKIGSPAGGPRDRIPPVVLETIPQNRSLGFRGNKIIITFDEYVQLDKISEKLMISPPLHKKPEVAIRGKSIIIQYEEELRDSTTYTFYFGDAIRDLNEANILNDYQFVFSTGSVIDSLSITGNVMNSPELDPVEAALVLLYSDLSDSAVIKDLPAYITKTNKQGYFRIDNIREGRYRLYSLSDDDNSKTFNNQGEKFDFLNSIITITAEHNYIPVPVDTVPAAPAPTAPGAKAPADTSRITGEYRLYMFTPEKKLHYLTSTSRDLQYQLRYILSLPPDSLAFRIDIPGISGDSYFTERSRLNDSLTVWLTDSTLYSQPEINTLITYPFTDSTGAINEKTDTVLMRFLKPKVPPKVKVRKTPYDLKSNIFSGGLNPGQRISFVSPTPFREPDTTKIRLYEIIENKRITQPFSFENDASRSWIIYLNAKILQGKTYLFTADSAAFGNRWGEVSDSTGNRFSIRKDDSFGTLKLNISNFEGSRIVQLLSKDEKQLIAQLKMPADGKAEFKMLDKGIYRVRVIYDLNSDGRWTTGDFLTGRQPEPASFFPAEIEIKENWNVDNDWNISKPNIKTIKSPEGGR